MQVGIEGRLNTTLRCVRLFWVAGGLLLSSAVAHGGEPVKLPAAFETNVGQLGDNSVVYFANYGDVVVQVRRGEFTILQHGYHALHLRWIGASGNARVEPVDQPNEARFYYQGGVQAKWRSLFYKSVSVREIYPGVDLTYRFENDRLVLNFVIAPGGARKSIRFEMVDSRDVKLLGDGEVGSYSNADPDEVTRLLLRQRRGIGLQMDSNNSGHIELGAGDAVKAVEAEVEILSKHASARRYPTRAMVQDRSGNIFVAAETGSLRLLLPEPAAASAAVLNGPFGSESHVLISKIPADGAMACSAFVEGNGSETPYGIAVDGKGSVYVAGETFSDDFPVSLDAFQRHKGGGADGFVLKMNAECDRLDYSSYLGGEDSDRATGIAVDSAGDAFVSGYTKSRGFPGLGRSAGSRASFDAFVTKLTAKGKLERTTVLGGRFDDYAFAIAADGRGSLFVAGQTNSTDFPVTAPGLIRTKKTASWDAFVVKLDKNDLHTVYSTVLGGHGTTYGTAIATDKDGSAYVTGYTNAKDFPTTPGVVQPSLAGLQGGLVAKLNATSGTLVYSTFIGGKKDDELHAIAVDARGAACVGGQTMSADYPGSRGVQGAVDPSHLAGVIACLNADGRAVTQSELLPGRLEEVLGIELESTTMHVVGLSAKDAPVSDGAVMVLRRQN